MIKAVDTIKINGLITFKDEWLEKELFGYGKYEVLKIIKSRNECTVKEITTGTIYEKIKIKEVLSLN